MSDITLKDIVDKFASVELFATDMNDLLTNVAIKDKDIIVIKKLKRRGHGPISITFCKKSLDNLDYDFYTSVAYFDEIQLNGYSVCGLSEVRYNDFDEWEKGVCDFHITISKDASDELKDELNKKLKICKIARELRDNNEHINIDNEFLKQYEMKDNDEILSFLVAYHSFVQYNDRRYTIDFEDIFGEQFKEYYIDAFNKELTRRHELHSLYGEKMDEKSNEIFKRV